MSHQIKYKNIGLLHGTVPSGREKNILQVPESALMAFHPTKNKNICCNVDVITTDVCCQTV
jgi:hypothetical protein